MVKRTKAMSSEAIHVHPQEEEETNEPIIPDAPTTATEGATGANIGDEGVIEGVAISENYEGDLIKNDSDDEVKKNDS